MNVSQLTEEQKKQIELWSQEGLGLSQIQQCMQEKLGMVLTYRDVRFLIDDLGLTLKDSQKINKPQETTPRQQEATVEAPTSAAVRVEVDAITRPGTVVSGKVFFSDGVQASWHVDTMGRVGIIPPQKGYTPSSQDIADFQVAVQNELRRLGF